MANNINIPFEMQLVAIKNANEIASTLSTTIALNLSQGVENGLKSINFNSINTNAIAKLDQSFLGVVNTIYDLNKQLGDASPLVNSLFKGLPSDVQSAISSVKELGAQARNILSGLTSQSEVVRKSAEEDLKNIVNSDLFKKNEGARATFFAELNKGLQEYGRTVESEGKKQLRQEEELQRQRVELVKSTEQTIVQETANSNKAQLDAIYELNKTKEKAYADFDERLRQQRAIEAQRARDELLNEIKAGGTGEVLPVQKREIDKGYQNTLELNNQLRRDALKLINEEIGLTNQLLKTTQALNSLGVGSKEDITGLLQRQAQLQSAKSVVERDRAKVDLNQSERLYDLIDVSNTTLANTRAEFELKTRNLQFTRDTVSYEKQYATEVSRVKQEQFNILRLLEKIKQVTGETGINDKGTIALRKFAFTPASQIAEGRLTGKTDIPSSQEIKNLSLTSKELYNITSAAKQAATGVERFGELSALAFKRYGAFLVGSFGLIRIFSEFQQATQEAIKFEAQMTKIEQVTTSSVVQLKQIAESVRNAGVITGTKITDIAEAVQTFAQAGFDSPEQLTKVATQLAKVPLAATFGDLKSTTEGLIAIFGQFNKDLNDTGEILDIVNQFAADFAVESGDIFEAVKRGGATFANANGSFREFVELFSLLRSSTRLSAETLGTFFKSGISQLLNPRSQKLLKNLGVDIDKDVVKQFRELSQILFAPNSRFNSKQVSNIAQQLTGDRQVANLIATLRELEKQRQKTLGSGKSDVDATLENINNSLNKSVEKRLDDLGTTFNQLRQSFNDFAIEILNDKGFKGLIRDVTNLTKEFILLGKVIAPIVPFLFGAVGASVLPKFTKGFRTEFQTLFSRKIPSASRRGASSDTTAIDLFDTSFDAASLVSAAGRNSLRSSRLDRIERLTRLRTLGRTVPTIAGGAALAAGSILNSSDVSIGGFSGSSVGSIINSGVTGAVIGGSLAGVPGAIIGGLVTTGIALKAAIIDNTSKLEIRNLREAKTTQEKIGVASSFLFKDSFNKSIFDKIGDAIGLDTLSDFLSGGAFSKRRSRLKAQRISNKASEIFTGKFIPSSVEESELADSLVSNVELLRNQIVSEETRKNPNASTEILQKTIVDRFIQELKNSKLFPSAGNTDEIISIVLSQSNLTTDKIKQGQDDILNNTEDFLRNLIVSINSGFDEISEGTGRSLFKLANFVTDLSVVSDVKLPTNNQDFFKSVGADSINEFNQQLQTDVKNLDKFLSGNNVRGIFRNFINTTTGTNEKVPSRDIIGEKSFFDVANEVFAGSSLGKQFTEQFQDLFERLKTTSGKTFTDLFQEIFKSNNLTEFLKSNQQPLLDIQEKLKQSIVEQVEVINTRIRVETALREKTRESNQQIAQQSNLIKSAQESRRNSFLDAVAFRTGLSETRIGRIRAGGLLNTANSSNFGDLNVFLNSLNNLAKNRINEAKFNELAQTSNISPLLKANFAESATRANQDYLDGISNLTLRLTEFDKRIAAAGQAAQILRESFNNLRQSAISAGQTAVGTADADLRKIGEALTKFRNQGGLQDIQSGIRGFTKEDFDFLQRGLQSIGGNEITNGLTGNRLLEEILKNVGIPFQGFALANLKGTSVDKESQNISQNLSLLRQQAEDAAQLEQSLQSKREEILNKQLDLLQKEDEFYKSQSKSLDSIGSNFTALEGIKSKVDKLFGNDAQPVAFIPDQMLIKPINNIEQYTSTLNNNVQLIAEKLSQFGTAASKLEVAPVQVNIGLTAPDILKVAGPQLRNDIMQAVGIKLSEVFGNSDPETLSKIMNSFSTNGQLT